MINKDAAIAESKRVKKVLIDNNKLENTDIIEVLYEKHKNRIEKYIDSKIQQAINKGKFTAIINSNRFKRISWQYRYSVVNRVLKNYKNNGYLITNDPEHDYYFIIKWQE